MHGHDAIWGLVFLMVILKIPIVYLCSVVYYAIKAEPKPEEGAAVAVQAGGTDGSGPGRRRRRRPRPPHGSPARTRARTHEAARAYADKK